MPYSKDKPREPISMWTAIGQAVVIWVVGGLIALAIAVAVEYRNISNPNYTKLILPNQGVSDKCPSTKT